MSWDISMYKCTNILSHLFMFKGIHLPLTHNCSCSRIGKIGAQTLLLLLLLLLLLVLNLNKVFLRGSSRGRARARAGIAGLALGGLESFELKKWALY